MLALATDVQRRRRVVLAANPAHEAEESPTLRIERAHRLEHAERHLANTPGTFDIANPESISVGRDHLAQAKSEVLDQVPGLGSRLVLVLERVAGGSRRARRGRPRPGR